MNISYNWLKRYIDPGMNAERLAEALTSMGLETGSVEEVESIKGGLRGIVIGKVLTCDEHPNSDHLHVTTVDLGDGQPTQIVCGAPNVAAGQTVVVATVGTTLYDGDNEFKIKKSKIRGIESFGMICAEDEIGVGTSHDGIIVISQDIKPGTPAAQYFGLTSDYVLEVDLTPNRIDAASHYGVARDLKAWLAQNATAAELHKPSTDEFAIDSHQGGITVEVADTEACPRYSGITVKGVKVAPSPEWLQQSLNAIGLRPINNVVDITNYILHGLGQPLHCFDASKIKGGKIIVRKATHGEPFVTLDGVQRHLDSADLMICNESEPMCMAGVFGGLDSGVTDQTTDIFIESAYFNPTTVRKTARRHGLSTDSSFRYERGTDPSVTVEILKIAALMVKSLAGGEITGPLIDIYPVKIEPVRVDLQFDYTDRLIGKKIPHDTIVSILKSLEMERLDIRPDGVAMDVPTYRVDVTRPCDVVEDILRIYGYNNVEISGQVRSALSYRSFEDEDTAWRRIISQQLTGMGFNEILNNSLTSVSYYEPLTEYPLDHCVKLLNPLSNDLAVMRQTLLFGGLESASHNINRKRPDVMMYEFGNVYTANPDTPITQDQPLAPFAEYSHLALWMSGLSRQGNWSRQAEETTFFDLKAVVLNILTRMGITPQDIKQAPAPQSEIFAASLLIDTRSGKRLGTMGILSKSLLGKADIKQPVVYAELDWRILVKLALKKKVTYTALPRTMAVKRDLALLIGKTVTMDAIETVVRNSERKLLRDITLFDVYEGDKLPAGKKSYAIAITLQDDEKTLNDKQIEATMSKIVTNLTKQLGAELR